MDKKPIYEDSCARINPTNDKRYLAVMGHDGLPIFINEKAVEAMAKSFGLIPTLADTDEVLPEAIFD